MKKDSGPIWIALPNSEDGHYYHAGHIKDKKDQEEEITTGSSFPKARVRVLGLVLALLRCILRVSIDFGPAEAHGAVATEKSGAGSC